MVTEQLEVERTYDVDPGFVVPVLTGVPGVVAVAAPVAHALEAVYLDSDDLRLVRARVTLRRRSGGADEGWHLKLPAGAARRELHLPLTADAAPPAEFLAAVDEILAGAGAGAGVGPVVTLRTQRVVTVLRDDADQVLAELADDTVEATVLPAAPGHQPELRSWREVEVELVAGDEPLLDAVGAVLVTAGARPSSRASELATALAGRLGGRAPR